jgi:hypothetical protein
MLKKLVENDKRTNNIYYLPDDPVKQTQYHHPFYANRTSYPAGPHLIQPRCPPLPTPQHNQFTFDDMMRSSQKIGSEFVNSYFPSSISVFFHQMAAAISGLIEDLFKIDRHFTLDQIVHLLMIENRLFYIGMILIILFGLRYLTESIFFQCRTSLATIVST